LPAANAAFGDELDEQLSGMAIARTAASVRSKTQIMTQILFIAECVQGLLAVTML
jgi:hypothetical protein